MAGLEVAIKILNRGVLMSRLVRGFWPENKTAHPPMREPLSGVTCREITETDLDGIIDLLTMGYRRERDRSHWTNAIRVLSNHPGPDGFPK